MLGLVAIHGLVLLGPVAAVLGGLELAAIDGGAAPLGGRGLARAALALGGSATLLAAGLMALWLTRPS